MLSLEQQSGNRLRLSGFIECVCVCGSSQDSGKAPRCPHLTDLTRHDELLFCSLVLGYVPCSSDFSGTENGYRAEYWETSRVHVHPRVPFLILGSYFVIGRIKPCFKCFNL